MIGRLRLYPIPTWNATGTQARILTILAEILSVGWRAESGIHLVTVVVIMTNAFRDLEWKRSSRGILLFNQLMLTINDVATAIIIQLACPHWDYRNKQLIRATVILEFFLV